MPDGNEANYTVPVVKVQNYTKEEIFDKKLLFFIPYYILRFEQDMKLIDSEENELKKLTQYYEDIYSRLCRLEARNEIDYTYLHDLISLTARLIDVVAGNSQNVKREVIAMGGGKVLEMESDKILQRGIEQGISQGISRGATQATMESIISFLEDYGAVPDELKEQICSENDIDKLKKWQKLSARVSSIQQFVDMM